MAKGVKACILHWHSLLLCFLCLSVIGQLSADSARLRPENELLLELRLDGESLGIDVLGYQRGDEFLVSLGELSSGLGFPIAISADATTANGWYIAENRTFSLDMGTGKVASDGRDWTLDDGEAITYQGDLFVTTDAIQKWFPLRLDAVIRQLFLEVETEEPLPVQKRAQLRDRYVRTAAGPNLPRYQLQDNPYRLLGPHITRARFSLATLREDFDRSAEYTSSHALLSRGDLGWMTSTLSLAGQSDETITSARIKLERTALNAPLGLNHIEIGDVDAGGYRGILLSSQDRSAGIGGRIDTDAVTLEGNQLPDWDVELYQNDQLILFQTVGEDGRYLFEDVPLLFGENRFELKFFGPQGETETREEFHFLGVGMLDPGKVSYELAAVQNGRTVFGINDVEDDADTDSLTYSGNFNLGLSRNLTAGAGIKSIESNGVRQSSSNFSLGLSTSRFYGSLSYVEPANAQSSLGSTLRTQVGRTGLSLGYTSFIDEPALSDNTQKWRGNIGLTSSIRKIPLKMEITAQEQQDSRLLDAVVGTTLPLAGAGRFSSSIWHTAFEESEEDLRSKSTQTGGQSSFHTVMRPWTFRFSANYGFEPETELLDLSFESNLRIERDLTLDLGLRQDTVSDKTYYGAGINWHLDPVSINARITFDSDERWSGLLTFSTSLIHAPGRLMPGFDSRTSVDSGIVEARIYEPLGDQEGSSDTQPKPGIGVKAVQAWKSAVSNDEGIAYLSRMPSHHQTDIELDESTIKDGELRSANSGVSIIARPGSYTVVEFPMIRTIELEGHVYVQNSENRLPVSRALVTLAAPDGTVVAQRRTAFDGFYLFDGIRPGTYDIVMEDALSGRLLRQPERITASSTNPLVQNLDFALLPAESTNNLASRMTDTESTPIVAAEAIEPSPAIEDKPIEPAMAAALPEPTSSSTDSSSSSDSSDSNAEPADLGNWFVQLGAYASAEVASTYWEELKSKSALLQDKSSKMEAFSGMTRLLVAPGMTQDSARDLCQSLKSESVDCMLREGSQ